MQSNTEKRVPSEISILPQPMLSPDEQVELRKASQTAMLEFRQILKRRVVDNTNQAKIDP